MANETPYQQMINEHRRLKELSRNGATFDERVRAATALKALKKRMNFIVEIQLDLDNEVLK